jgi:membrane protease YdiL (CAAX protease family)
MVVAAIVWASAREATDALLPGPGTVGLLPGAGAGIGFGLAVVLGIHLAVRRPGPLRRLTARLGELLGPLDGTTIFVLALASAIGEELFFRGAMQPAWGFWTTTLIFGAIHLAPERGLLIWTATALLLGGCLGALSQWSGSLAGPMLAHFTINYFNLHLIEALRAQGGQTPSARTPEAG